MAVRVAEAVAVPEAPVASAWLADRASASRADRASVLDWDRAREPARDQELASGRAMVRAPATAWATMSCLTVRSGSTVAFPSRHTRPRSRGRAPEPEVQKLT
jgi:hypothetical protein